MNTTMLPAPLPTSIKQPGNLGSLAAADEPTCDLPEALLPAESGALLRLRLQIQRIAPYFRAALVRGEEGTGKASWARALHDAATLDRRPFVFCGPGVLEGAAQAGGAGGQMQTLVDAARGGSLYFAQIAESSVTAQALLVQLLERLERDRREHRGGDRGEVRVIASSREDLRVLSTMGRFRQDLYQRVSLVEVVIPPLRERMEDLPVLARHLAERFAGAMGGMAPELGAKALERMSRHRWPGNVRELETVMRLSVARCKERVLCERDLPALKDGAASVAREEQTGRPRSLQEVVDEHVGRVMRECAGNKLRAAEILGVSRSTLYRMLEAAVEARPTGG